MQKKLLGKLGEELALNYLKSKGFKFVDRNYFSRFGEIDLIMMEKDALVFVEVKTRWSIKYGKPEQSVTPWKLKSIIRTAQLFSINNKKLPKKQRIDVVAIVLDEENKIKSLNHIRNATG